jgi:NAD(P)-dependent dehydrogenase (short-subunit alcohol dehydrogenase family)
MRQHLKNRVAIVTGAGGGLGRAHALELARHGARVVVNDLHGEREGSSASRVVEEILRRGGEALLDGADVRHPAQVQAMVEKACAKWGRVDILVNNAGILRDRSFAKMSFDDFRLVLDVHVMGAVHCTQAVWGLMRSQNHGRIVMTTSSSGLYGNFGQANYGAAKMALVGLMQTLALEGASYNICVNCLAPSAATGMTEGVLSEDILLGLAPEKVSPGLIALVGDDAPTRMILLAGAGSFECAHVTMTRGVFIDGSNAAEQVRDSLDDIRDPTGQVVPASGWEQYKLELSKAGLGREAASAG